jgi:3D (Asp-Asp-Asp) domain-containing protein
VLFAVGYLADGEINSAVAADGPSTLARQAASLELPANFKDRSGVTTSEKDVELQDFHATAYSLKGLTASGERVRPGVIAADPRVLPLGTVVHIRAGRYTGNYTVLDTGGRIKGRKVDIYMPTYKEAKKFGRQRVKIRVISRKKT